MRAVHLTLSPYNYSLNPRLETSNGKAGFKKLRHALAQNLRWPKKHPVRSHAVVGDHPVLGFTVLGLGFIGPRVPFRARGSGVPTHGPKLSALNPRLG